ncbi:DUF7144 family membrane protein [Micromonospora sp. DT47]|uniref:DUF7144 family membrane protein n=1 Tax=Micromonospora sp. DT47 TaxID=3393431 RepID=UPI003CF1234A
MGSPRAASDAGTVVAPGTSGPRRPLLAAGLLAGSGLVNVVASYAITVADSFMVVTRGGVYEVDITGWAWLHVAFGAAVTIAGLLVVTGRRWTARVAIVCAVLTIGIDVLVFPFAPFRAVLVVALSGSAIRLLIRHHRARPSG